MLTWSSDIEVHIYIMSVFKRGKEWDKQRTRSTGGKERILEPLGW